MTLQATIGQQTPLRIVAGVVAAPSAIRADALSASLADFWFNSLDFRFGLNISIGTVSVANDAIVVAATASDPRFVGASGAAKVNTAAVSAVGSGVAGARFIYANTNNATIPNFTIRVGASGGGPTPSPALHEVTIAKCTWTGTAFDPNTLDTSYSIGFLPTFSGLVTSRIGPGLAGFRMQAQDGSGSFSTLYRDAGNVGTRLDGNAGVAFFVTDAGQLQLNGSGAGLRFEDTVAFDFLTLARASGVLTCVDSVNGTLLSLGNTGLFALSGAGNGVKMVDRANARFSTLYRTGDHTKIDDSVNGTILDIDNTGQVAQAAELTVGGTGVAFQNAWVNVGGAYQAARYYKDPDGFVHLAGAIKTGAAFSVAFTLPVGYRPAATRAFPIAYFATAPGWATSVATVDNTGAVTVIANGAAAGAIVGLDGLYFNTR